MFFSSRKACWVQPLSFFWRNKLRKRRLSSGLTQITWAVITSRAFLAGVLILIKTERFLNHLNFYFPPSLCQPTVFVVLPALALVFETDRHHFTGARSRLVQPWRRPQPSSRSRSPPTRFPSGNCLRKIIINMTVRMFLQSKFMFEFERGFRARI